MLSKKVFGGIAGLCIGDALGVPYEGFSRQKMEKSKKILALKSGLWSDDSSLTLCLLRSLTKSFDLNDIAARFILWLDNGYMTPEGKAFGIGRTTCLAINNLKEGRSPLDSGLSDESSNGNGSLMRILPLAFYAYNMEIEERFHLVSQVSAITHRHPRSVLACCIYVQMAAELLCGKDKIAAYDNTRSLINNYYKDSEQLRYFDRIIDNDIDCLQRQEIESGGYVVHTLEAAFWCFLNNSSYSSCVIDAINLGYDTDTTAAVSGGLAGIYYSIDSIPADWLEQLAKKDEIMNLSKEFYNSLKIYGRD